MADKQFTDDSSSVLGLGHGAVLHLSEWQIRQQAEREQYIIDFGIAVKAEKLTAYYRERGHRPQDAEAIAIEQFLTMRSGVYERIWKYLDRSESGVSDAAALQAIVESAVLQAEAEMNSEADLADRVESAGADDTLPDDPGPWSERKVVNLMARENTGGSGSSRKGPRKREKAIVAKCENCHQGLTADLNVCQECGHEVVKHSGRSAFVGAKVSQRVKDALYSPDMTLTAGQIVEAFVSAGLSSGFSPGQMADALEDMVENMNRKGAA